MEPLEAFFRGYRWFTYLPGESASTQLQRLRKEARWARNDEENDNAWMSYRTALVRQFNATYSFDENDLAAWHAILRHISINNPPPTVAECKRLINGKFINLIDLVDARHDPDVKIVHFATETELSEYTLEENKIFPRSHVEAGTLLRYLLRHIMEPNPDRRDPTQFKKQKEKTYSSKQTIKHPQDPTQKKKKATKKMHVRGKNIVGQKPKQKKGKKKGGRKTT